ncbi:unnamed protein product [Cladocopium goreaui]|uniref:Uncharacterized protein n=1 Tax=Cladocopium goreaui TaxID=2562237 RepID=A0A9P1G748_9DINO|nr:unnamed protein product [Cladocopium goreaui]
MAICKGSGLYKAFGKKGDFIDALKSGARWFDLWKTKVCQTVLVATMHAECSVVRILCIEGGPNCDEEYKSIPDLKKAVKDDMKKQNGREVEVVCEWMTMELFERNFGSQAKDDIPAQVAADAQVEADEAAAAKYTDIAGAALNGDLPAVRGHLRRDRGSLDRLDSSDRSALHWAAVNDHPAVVAFLVAKGAAVDVLGGLGRTPLHLAAWSGHVACAQLLLAAKASVDSKNNLGQTPLDLAREEDETEMVSLLMGKA